MILNSRKFSAPEKLTQKMTRGGLVEQNRATGETSILTLIAARLLCAVGGPCVTAETTVTLDCGGHAFTAKGKTVTDSGWKGTGRRFLAALKRKPEDKPEETVLPGSALRTIKSEQAPLRGPALIWWT